LLVLGIDPGDPCGWGILERESGDYVASGEVATSRTEHLRLLVLARRFREAVRPYSELEDELAFELVVCETVFVYKNWQTAVTLSARRGAVLACVNADQLLEPNPKTWIGSRKPSRLELEAKALAGRDVGEHERDALLQAVWARREKWQVPLRG
jgi:hypothetical protein